ncbi:hypothetical protein C8F01DRAFT_1271264 [Mycena amicta]|nr:hypothetical protein C8F01DRAFT_1271264 [Mycena amicta]
MALARALSTLPLPPPSAAMLATSATPSSVACKDIDHCRRLFDIVWSCLATIFACIWVSVHPNIPPPTPPAPSKGASLWMRAKWILLHRSGALRSRLKLMTVALFAPEFIAGFAVRQLLDARRLSREFDISLTHGFFICMGGFADAHGHPIITREQLQQPGCIEAIRATSEATILDKSKSDALSKAVAFFQGIWFVVQCIARLNQDILLTELEVVTLAFAVLNLFTWLFWWSKPLNVQEPIVVGLNPRELEHHPVLPTSRQKRPWQARFATLIGRPYDSDEYNPLEESVVPTFWDVSSSTDGRTDEVWPQLLLALLFGAIHFAGIGMPLPTLIETVAWWTGSILLILIPLLLTVLLASFRDSHITSMVLTATFMLPALLYMSARLLLLVLPLTTLRSLPARIFVDVSWTAYIPHI